MMTFIPEYEMHQLTIKSQVEKLYKNLRMNKQGQSYNYFYRNQRGQGVVSWTVCLVVCKCLKSGGSNPAISTRTEKNW
jgi:hypothetical protein